ECPRRRKQRSASQGKPSRSIARPFEIEFPPARRQSGARFASEFATERSSSVAKSLNRNEEDWRRERDSNRGSNFRNQQVIKIKGVSVPVNPHPPPDLAVD